MMSWFRAVLVISFVSCLQHRDVSAQSCPLSFSALALNASASACQTSDASQVTADSACCKRINLALQTARADYARTPGGGGVLLLPSAEATLCIRALQAELEARGVPRGGALLSTCGFAAESISADGVGRCGRLSSLDAFRAAPEVNLTQIITTSCAHTATASSCYNCATNLTGWASLFAFGSNGTFDRGSCAQLLQLAVVALGQDQPALAQCFFVQGPNPVPPPECTAMDLSRADTSYISQFSPPGAFSELAALLTVGTYVVLSVPYVNASGNTFLSDEQAAACLDGLLDELSEVGVLFNSSDRVRYGMDAASWQAGSANCSGLLTLDEWGNRLEGTISAVQGACDPYTCNSTCQAALQEPSIALGGVAAPFLNLVYCERQLSVAAFARKTTNLTEVVSSMNCVLSLPDNVKLRLLPPPSPSTAIPASGSSSNTAKLVGAIVGSLGGALLIGGVVLALLVRKRRRARRRRHIPPGAKVLTQQSSGALNWFTYSQMRAATNDFSESCLLGSGGSGQVFKGRLSDGTEVAIKELSTSGKRHEAEFFNEIGVISSVRHKNLVELKGCCGDGGHWLVVYAYMPNLSLDKHLYRTSPLEDRAKPAEDGTPAGWAKPAEGGATGGSRKSPAEDRGVPAGRVKPAEEGGRGGRGERPAEDGGVPAGRAVLDWPMRFAIAVGATRGLAYLHEDVTPRIIHRDVKPSNILLDENFKARVADFGLAKLTSEDETHVTTGVVGTWGYLSPEYVASGQLTEKSDVYALGVVLLEIVSGRRPVEPEAVEQQEYLVEWAWQLAESNRLFELLDPRLVDAVKTNPAWRVEVERSTQVAIHCVHTMPQQRPSMGQCLRMLEGTLEVPPLPPRPLTLFTMFSRYGGMSKGSGNLTTSTASPFASSRFDTQSRIEEEA